mmetsp:Transcript_9038/g.19367  ORF Transcript_9038/g.19367 Transcript_9038/m.19367 type:complete len:287 (-) Transcript_9038:1635-2495(-)
MIISGRKTFHLVSLPLSTYAFIFAGFSFADNNANPPSHSSALHSSFNVKMGRGSNVHKRNTILTQSIDDSTNACENTKEEKDPYLPKIIVFDLDDCLLFPEAHELSGMPSQPVEGPLDPNNPSTSPLGTVGMRVPSRRRGGYDLDGEVVELYPGARLALRELATNPRYRHVEIAVASTSLEPSYSRAALRGIEVIPDVSVMDMISYSQIGRSGKLTSRKTSHFRMIHEESGGVPYEEMLFFDDCNWQDHVGDLRRSLGVMGVRTPNGLQLEEFHRGLEKFRAEKQS